MLNKKDFRKKIVEKSYSYKVAHVIYIHKFSGITDYPLNLEVADFGDIEKAFKCYAENGGILGFSNDFINF